MKYQNINSINFKTWYRIVKCVTITPASTETEYWTQSKKHSHNTENSVQNLDNPTVEYSFIIHEHLPVQCKGCSTLLSSKPYISSWLNEIEYEEQTMHFRPFCLTFFFDLCCVFSLSQSSKTGIWKWQYVSLPGTVCFHAHLPNQTNPFVLVKFVNWCRKKWKRWTNMTEPPTEAGSKSTGETRWNRPNDMKRPRTSLKSPKFQNPPRNSLTR